MQFDGGFHEWEAKKAFKWTLMPKGLAAMSLETCARDAILWRVS
jgi:hypothetical protein